MNYINSKLNPDAEEFKPSGIVEKVQSMNMISEIIMQAFDINDEISGQAVYKLQQVISSSSFSDAPYYVAISLVDASVCKSGNATLGMKTFKRIQGVSLQSGVFDRIHELSLTYVNDGYLRKMAETNSLSGLRPDNVSILNDRPVLLVELIHLIVMCITDLCRPMDDGPVAAPPVQPCIDLCLLADATFEVQMKCCEAKEKSPNILQKVSPVNNWNCLLDVFLSKLSHTIPYFLLTIQYSESYVPPKSWLSTPATSNHLLEDNNKAHDPALPSASLASLLNKVLFRVKRMIVMDAVFSSPWLRSTALDLLLSASSIFGSPVAAANSWYGPIGTADSDEGDDVSIEGLTAADNSEVYTEFRNFLQSSGQS